MKALNLGLSFLLELGMLAVFAYWGFQTQTGAAQWLLGIGIPLCVIVIWGIFLAPKSQHRLKNPAWLLAKIALFGLSVLALWAAEQPTLALLFGVAVAINLGLATIWSQ